MTVPEARSEIAQCERAVRRNGRPLLIAGHPARRDMFGHAAPFLLVVLIGQLSGALYRTEFIGAFIEQMTTVTATRMRYQALFTPSTHVLDASAPTNG